MPDFRYFDYFIHPIAVYFNQSSGMARLPGADRPYSAIAIYCLARGTAATPSPFSDMELRVVDEVVFKLGSQAVDQGRLRLGRE